MDRNIQDAESVEIDVDICMALCNLKRRAADGTLGWYISFNNDQFLL